MNEISEHPNIKNFLIFGNPYGEEEKQPICPICGEEAEKIYKNSFEPVGCDICIEEVDAWEWMDEDKEDV